VSKRVLIAEDDATSRRILEALLQRWGYAVELVADGERAWQRLQGVDAPRLVVLDWQMPGLDGLEVLRRLRRLDAERRCYVLFVTTRDQKRDLVVALEAGADDYLTKPFEPDELRARVEVGRRFIELRGELDARLADLQGALDHVKTLQGVLPVCMYCHKIRSDLGAWDKMERYIEAHSDAQFSHSICPDCLQQHYPEEDEGGG
jgi:DNA-binding response OmpR family regulator